MRRRTTKALYPDHPPSLHSQPKPQPDRSNRLLCVATRGGDVTQYRIAADLNPATSGSLELCCFHGASIGCSFIKSARYELIRLAEPQGMGRSNQVARVRGVRQRRKIRAECGGRAWRRRYVQPSGWQQRTAESFRVRNASRSDQSNRGNAKAHNDEVERRGVALPTNEADLYRSSTPSLAQRRRDSRSLQPIVRRERESKSSRPARAYDLVQDTTRIHLTF
jgi:hypothetical protein